jgi:lipoprotein-anchoring transpeptidase ErfK/SrfK
MISRRSFVAAAAVASLSACSRPLAPDLRPDLTGQTPPVPEPIPPLPAFYGAVLDEPYPVPAIPEGVVAQRLWRQEVPNPFPDQPQGTIIVNPDAANLHLVGADGTALRYGVCVGADGFAWNGDAVVQFTRAWPRWKAPDSMVARWPRFEPYSVANGGMAPGPGNPLGARALYLFQDGKDTLYRIHGACEPEHLGQAASSGCIRLLDQDIIDLEKRTRHAAKVVVLPSVRRTQVASLY